jgi:hypothetical protein
MMFQIVALICALGQDPAECEPPTARDVIVIGESPSTLACQRDGALALGKIAALIGEREYPKVICRRRNR